MIGLIHIVESLKKKKLKVNGFIMEISIALNFKWIHHISLFTYALLCQQLNIFLVLSTEAILRLNIKKKMLTVSKNQDDSFLHEK